MPIPTDILLKRVQQLEAQVKKIQKNLEEQLEHNQLVIETFKTLQQLQE